MKHLVDLMLAVNADYYSFEAANARHEHEWKVWKDVKLPAGKKILPGIVTHSTKIKSAAGPPMDSSSTPSTLNALFQHECLRFSDDLLAFLA